MTNLQIKAAYRIGAALLRQSKEKMLWSQHKATSED